MSIMNNVQNQEAQYMVHCFRTESVVFRGSESECIEYINEHDKKNFPLELYVADVNDPHFIHDKERLEHILQSYKDDIETEYWN